MGGHLSLLLLVAGAGLWWWQHRRFTQDYRQTHAFLNDLIAGREPRPFRVSGGRFQELCTQLRQLADEQERLRRSWSREEMNLQTILASMGEGVLVVDTEHVIRLVNPSFVRLLGLNAAPVGQSVLNALSNEQFETIVTSVLATGQPESTEIMLAALEPPRHLGVAATQMRSPGGEPAVVMLVHDVTRLKQLEDVRREFVANVSHELRTPLSIFQGYLETLLDNPDFSRAELVDVFRILQRHSARLNLLVEDLLILARLESRSVQLNVEPIEVEDFLQQIAADWLLRSKEKKIAITVEVAPDVTRLWADRLRMEQLLNNLIANAVKYSGHGNEVTLAAHLVNKELEIRVEDNGIGMSPSDLPHIFERFYRVDKSRQRDQGGTGLGLSIVKHIAQLHGGSVEAESAVGKGTCITVRLPLTARTGIE
jgi:two-component system, OmpR family, phosphate regulon sensor histidine kinase PhoR